jgi:hypothetical protein
VAGAFEGLREARKVNERYDVATIGIYTKDTIVTSAGTRHVDGGGVQGEVFLRLARALDLFPVTVENNMVKVDTGKRIKRSGFEPGEVVKTAKV